MADTDNQVLSPQSHSVVHHHLLTAVAMLNPQRCQSTQLATRAILRMWQHSFQNWINSPLFHQHGMHCWDIGISHPLPSVLFHSLSQPAKFYSVFVIVLCGLVNRHHLLKLGQRQSGLKQGIAQPAKGLEYRFRLANAVMRVCLAQTRCPSVVCCIYHRLHTESFLKSNQLGICWDIFLIRKLV